MRKTLITTTALVLAFTLAVFGVGEVLSAPSKSIIGPPPSELAAKSVSFADSSGRVIAGWFSRGQPGQGSVLLLHGVRSDRRQMLARAMYLHSSGYSVLLVDLQGHGESGGDRITFGYREAEGVKAAIKFLRDTAPKEKIAVIGVSLGAAAFTLSSATPPPSAVILESMYPTIEEAVSDRLQIRLGSAGEIFTPLLLLQLPLRLGIGAEDLRPIDHIASIGAPLLIISGTEDRHTTVKETERLFDAAKEPKELWLVEGAAHVDLHAFRPHAYEERISAFLRKYLRNTGRTTFNS